MIGTVLSNRYKILAELGSGGMAWVYLAEDLSEGVQVAIKVLYPHLSHEGGFLQRFVQEARVAMSLSAAPQMHVVRVLDYGSDRDTHYLVMEYIDGRDLRQVLDQDGPLTWQEAFDVARQVALALGYAHEHGIVHRDIKPGNILVARDGTVRVLDFGVARARNSPALTQSGFVGSPYYAAPEQAMGRPVDIRADLYSLGVVLCELLTGKLPFEADTPWGVITQHIATPPPQLDESYPHIPGPVARLVRRAMAKRPEDRFQTPAEMAQVLEDVLLGVESPLEWTPAETGVLDPLLEGLYTQAQQAAGAGLWQEAVDLFTQILKLEPRYRDVPEQLAEAGRQARLSALYAGARRSIKSGQWAEALAQLDEIARSAPDYRDVRELQATVKHKQQLDQLYRQGVQYMEAGEWAAAVDSLGQVIDREPSYGQASELLATARAELTQARQPADPVAKSYSRGTSRPTPGRDRRRSLWWAVVTVLLAALAVESVFIFQAKQPAPVVAGDGLPLATSANAGQVGLAAPIEPTLTATDQPSAYAISSPTRAQATLTASASATPSPRPTRTRRPTVTPTTVPTATSTPPPTHTAILTASPLPTLSAPVTLPSTPPPAVPTAVPPLAGQIAFPRFDAGRRTYDVYLCRVDGKACRLVAADSSQPDLLPGGGRVAVHSWQPQAKGLAVYDLAGGLMGWIATDSEAARPSVDARGDYYVYYSRQDTDRVARLYRTEGIETLPIYDGSHIVPGQSPSWLPDGRITYSGCVGNACGILVARADGTAAQQIVAGGAETNPEPSPDGRQVVFMSRRDGNWEVYRVGVDGTNLRRLTQHPADDGLPTWSPDGRYIAFASNRDGRWQIWVMAADGADQRPLFPIGGSLDGQVASATAHETHGWVEERISWGPLP